MKKLIQSIKDYAITIPYVIMLIYVIYTILDNVKGENMENLDFLIGGLALLIANVIAIVINTSRGNKKLEEVKKDIETLKHGEGYSLKTIRIASDDNIEKLSTGADNSHLVLKKNQEQFNIMLRDLISTFKYRTSEGLSLQVLINSLLEFNSKNDAIIAQLKERIIELEKTIRKEHTKQKDRSRDE